MCTLSSRFRAIVAGTVFVCDCHLAKKKKKSVLSTYKWYTTRMLVLPFAKRMHVCCTTIVRCKNSSNRHETLRVATCLQITPYMTHSTGISNVSLSYVVLTIITMLLLFCTREPKHFLAFSFRKLEKKNSTSLILTALTCCKKWHKTQSCPVIINLIKIGWIVN